MTPRAFGAGLLLVLALATGACGSGGGSHSDTAANRTRTDTGTAGEAAVRKAIKRVMTTDDPANCVRLATDAFIQDLYRGSIKKCKRETQKGKSAKSVRITQVTIDGGTARAHVVASGGDNDGQALLLVLARADGIWKVDDARYLLGSDPKTDKEINGVLDAVKSESLRQGFGAVVSTCAEERLRVAFRSGGTPFGRRTLREETRGILFACLREHPSASGPLRQAFFRALRKAAPKKLGRGAVDCVIGELRARITPKEIVQAASGQPSPSIIRKTKAAAEKCGTNAAILKALNDRRPS